MTERVRGRIHAATGNSPEILRETDQGTGDSELLDYRMKKLINTGFKENGNSDIDQEMDGLIQFCLEHMT